jgi:hypothetical protein
VQKYGKRDSEQRPSREAFFFSGTPVKKTLPVATLFFVSPRSRSFIAVGADAMGAVDNPLFAEDDFSAFAPEDGVQAPEPSLWNAEPSGPLQPPSPLLDAAQREKLRASRHDRRFDGKRERRDGQRRRALEAKNEALEQEISSLRRASEIRADEALATRASALRHLKAAEDHVGLLIKESAAKLETLAAEKENDRRRRATSDDAASARSPNDRTPSTMRHGDTPKSSRSSAGDQNAARMQTEIAKLRATQAEMDAEAEEREEELRNAVARVEALEAMLKKAGVLGH